MMIFVTPMPGARVRNPDHGFAVMPSTGDVVTDSPHFRRLAAEGSVKIETMAERKSAKKAAIASTATADETPRKRASQKD